MFKKIIKNKKGSAMVFTVVLLANALIIVGSIIFISAMLSKNIGAMYLSTEAFQKADSGMENFLYKINKSLTPPENINDLCTSFSDGKCVNQWEANGTEMSVYAFFLNGDMAVLDDGSTSITDIEYIKVVGEVADGNNEVSRSIRATVFASP